ncbi:MAG: hypothetical protein R3254_00740 [Thiomicrorhabdus sp.]|nr:hypothetical protein [Thiomicrorhabdus sp.]
MPHISVEYSYDSLARESLPGLVDSLFADLVNTQVVNPLNIKVRAQAVEFYKLGLENSGFMHAICRTHSGKTASEKRCLTQAILKSLQYCAKKSAKHPMVITVELQEMDSNSYAKSVIDF